jgi:hypothetical protein
MASLFEQAPAISMVLVRVLAKAPPFIARAEVHLASTADPEPSAASGTLIYSDGKMLWQAKVGEIKSPQFTESAAALFKRVNGDRVSLLTRPDRHTNYLILSGAKACVTAVLPAVQFVGKKVPLKKEVLDGHACIGEKLTAACADGSWTELLVWRARDLKNLPLRVQMRGSGGVLTLRFSAVQLRPVAVERFQVPGAYAQYGSIEDLVQSVLVDRMKRRMGLN